MEQDEEKLYTKSDLNAISDRNTQLSKELSMKTGLLKFIALCVPLFLVFGAFLYTGWLTPTETPALHHQNELIVKFYNNETQSAIVFWQIHYKYADGTIIETAGMGNVTANQSTYGALYFNVTDGVNETVSIKAWAVWFDANQTDGTNPHLGNLTIDSDADLTTYADIQEYNNSPIRYRFIQIPFVLDKE
jgi:hypothetical protein